MNGTLWPFVSILASLGAFGIGFYFYSGIKKLPSANEEIDHYGKLIRDGHGFADGEPYSPRFVCHAVIIGLFLRLSAKPILSFNWPWVFAYLRRCHLRCRLRGHAVELCQRQDGIRGLRGLTHAYRAGFRGGAVMGLAIVGSCLLGSSIVYLIFPHNPNFLLAFSFGASSLALFAKAGGGIFTKTADIAADLTGKIELGIPEDDPRNPAVIADNVGDNVGDVAGMGADLFDSNVAAIAAALVLALDLSQAPFIFMISAMGLVASMIGVFASNVREGGSPGRLNRAPT